MFVLVFLLFAAVDAVYFTITDLQVTIPIDKGKPFTVKQPVATFHTVGQPPLNFSISSTKYLKITSSGDVHFSDNFFKTDIEKLDQISAEIAAQDSSTKQTQTSLSLDIRPLNTLDCDLFVEDLCFWKEGEYQIEENSKPGFIASVASPFLVELCPSYNVQYSVLGGNEKFRVGVKGVNRFIESTRVFDREEKSKYVLPVLCTLENSKRSIWNISRNLTVTILDVDDNLPVPQEKSFQINMSSKNIQKNHIVSLDNLIFTDKDSKSVNKFKPTVFNDTQKLLKAQCKTFENDYLKPESGTAVHCKLIFTRNVIRQKWTYPVMLQLKDITLTNENKTVFVPIVFHFLNDSGYHPALIKEPTALPHLYYNNKLKIFRTAAPLARLTKPAKPLEGATHFSIKTVNYQVQDIFNVTRQGGIVFVHDSRKLKESPDYLQLNVTWMYNNNSVKWDELGVQIMDELTKTCETLEEIGDWSLCSEINTPSQCQNTTSCGLGTGGASSIDLWRGPGRCMWRGDSKPSKQSTEFYSTCTPDITTCPNGKCDELEMISDICPQDCTSDASLSFQLNPKTGRGIMTGSGVCTCTAHSCQCNPVDFFDFEDFSTTPIPNQNETHQSNVSRHISNRKILDIALSKCGATCAFGIVAGVLFLGGAVAVIVICWRLDRVKKTVQNKSDENPELSVPLSDYIERSHPDPLPLSFEMTTSLADTVIFSIINKYASDPKWEFPRNQLIIEQTLGEGEFGKVLRAKAFNISGQPGQTTVAVKTLKDDARESELKDLLSEYQLLKEVSHPNVIQLLGVCTAPGGPIYLIIEFAEHGSLRNYLRRTRHLKSECGRLPSSAVDEPEIHYDEPNISKVTPKEILSFAWQICKGMAYISEIKLVHRDLAARNVLLASDKICKISDFGLTRDIYEDDAYFKKSKSRVPVKWMAPESLSDHIYTNKSDVWSFGILVWELVTLGATPYPGIAVQNLFHLLKQGYRMERPDNCSPALYNIIRSCWHLDPEQRPTFGVLSTLWEKMLSDEVEYLDLANNAIHNRSYFCTTFEDSPTEPPEKSESNPLNYLSKSQSYIKCGSVDKFQDSSTMLKKPDNNQNDINTQGYETPVRIPKKVQTPTNDNPQYYTDMASRNSH